MVNRNTFAADYRRSRRETPTSDEEEQELRDREEVTPNPLYSFPMLGDPRLKGAANEPTRVEVMHQAQRTHGNRAVQRVLQVQRSANTYDKVITDDEFGEKLSSKSGEGEKLKEPVRVQLEKDLKADLAEVRVHTDAEADHLARAVKATAFTSAQNIFFAAGAFAPESNEGLKLLAHEALHTVQQSKGPVDGKPTDAGVTLSEGSDTFEAEAVKTAEEIAQKHQPGAVPTPETTPENKSQLEEPANPNFTSPTLYVQRG